MAEIHNLKRAGGLVLAMMLFLSGCGSGGAQVPDVVEQNSLIIRADGRLTAHIVDVFDKEYYDLNGLRNMAKAEVDAYQSAHQSTQSQVVLTRVEAVAEGENSVVVTYDFDNAGTYGDYTGKRLYWGMVSEAGNAGYDFAQMNQILVNVSGGNSLVSGELESSGMGNRHVVILEEGVRVYAPYGIAYISENAELTEDGSVDTTAIFPEEYPVVIVLDK